MITHVVWGLKGEDGTEWQPWAAFESVKRSDAFVHFCRKKGKIVMVCGPGVDPNFSNPADHDAKGFGEHCAPSGSRSGEMCFAA